MVGARVNIRVKYRLAEDTIGKRLLERDPRAKACLHGQHDRSFYNFQFLHWSIRFPFRKLH